MSGPPLPHAVSLRKAVTREALYSGVLGGAELPQFASMLGEDRPLSLDVQFGRDEEDRQIARVTLRGDVTLECQRCLGAVTRHVDSESVLGLVLTDAQAQALPRHYEPWIVDDDVDLWAVAAEELALALPVVAYHDAGECRAPLHEAAPAPEAQGVADNPFGVLSSLLDGEDAKE